MQKPPGRIKFALDFAQKNLDDLSPNGWEALREGMEGFLSGGRDSGGFFAAALPVGPRQISEKDIKALQKETRRIFKDMLKARSGSFSSGAPLIQLTTAYSLQNLDRLVPQPGRNALYLIGHVRDVFLQIVFLMIARRQTDKIIKCKNKRCSIMFWRTGRREFCSSTCKNSYGSKKFRATPAGKAYEAKRQRERYRAKKQNEMSVNVRVGKKV